MPVKSERIYIAACGICCSVCRLFTKGICSPCGSGEKEDAKIVQEKVERQIRDLGRICRKLACVVEKQIGYCMRDCDDFPCDKYVDPTFPYSQRFHEMFRLRSRTTE